MNTAMSNKLGMEELGNVCGGYYFYNQDGSADIINDDDGRVICTIRGDESDDPEYIKNMCKKLGQTPTLLTWLELDCLREHPMSSR